MAGARHGTQGALEALTRGVEAQGEEGDEVSNGEASAECDDSKDLPGRLAQSCQLHGGEGGGGAAGGKEPPACEGATVRCG